MNIVRETFKTFQTHLSTEVKTRIQSPFYAATNVHKPDGSPNVFIFTTPRSGSTWLLELIWSQRGFKCVNEPFNLRKPLICRELKISSWTELYNQTALPNVQAYLGGYCQNKVHVAEPFPLRNRHYRFFTNRIVFKIIHSGEDRANLFRDSFNGRVVFFLRHPIAVSLSRKAFPRLQAFVSSDYRRHFTAAQLKFAEQVIATGSVLERGVLDWCFQNAVMLREMEDDWAVVSYEQFVLNPEPVVDYLAGKLALVDKQQMLAWLTKASRSTRKSDEETRKLTEKGADASKREQLVSKWRSKVSSEDERKAMAILEVFEIDVYRFGELLPKESFWIGRKPPAD